LEIGTLPNSQQLKHLQNKVGAAYRQKMKPEIDKLMKQEDKIRQNSKDGLSV
jgi:hypothetical protein